MLTEFDDARLPLVRGDQLGNQRPAGEELDSTLRVRLDLGRRWRRSREDAQTREHESLACTVTATQTARDGLEALRASPIEAEQLLGLELVDDCRDPETGLVHPLVVVTDNGPAFKSDSSSPSSC